MLGFILDLPASDLEEAAARTGKITSASLYELLITRWLQGEIQRARSGRAELVLRLEQLWKAVTDFALLLWSRTEKGILQRDIPDSLWASLSALDPSRPLDPREARAAASSRSLLVRTEDGRFLFMHESIPDWLVARAAAAELGEAGDAPCLAQKAMSDLMCDFLGSLAGPETAVKWARNAMSGGEAVALANANRVLRRLGADHEEEGQIPVVLDLSGHDPSMSFRTITAMSTISPFRPMASSSHPAPPTTLFVSGTSHQVRSSDILGSRRFAASPFLLTDSHSHLAPRPDTIVLWDVTSGKLRRRLQVHSGAVRSLAFSPDGRTLASGSDDGSVLLWGVFAGKAIPLAEFGDPTHSVAYSPDGLTLVASSGQGPRLWHVASGKRLRSLRGQSSVVAFSPDGITLASGSADRTIRLWRLPSPIPAHFLEGHSGAVSAIAFFPDGNTLASGSDDGTIRIWSVADGACLAVLIPAPQGWAAYTPDGRYKYSGDVTGYFWHAVGLVRFDPGELVGYEDAFTEQKPVRLKDDDPLW